MAHPDARGMLFSYAMAFRLPLRCAQKEPERAHTSRQAPERADPGAFLVRLRGILRECLAAKHGPFRGHPMRRVRQ
jgi:hypothetical protein